MSEQIDFDEGIEETYTSDPQDDLDVFAASDEAEARFSTVYVLKCFGNSRRGINVNSRINRWLGQKSLEMIPSIQNADYYGEVTIRRIKTDEGATGAPREGSHRSSSANVEASGWVLSSLKEDDEKLDYLVYGVSVEKALELMRQKGRSKLPLFLSKDDHSNLIGTVTLADITFDQTTKKTKILEKASTQVPVIGTNEKLLDWIPTILTHGFVYGKNDSGEIVQIYTTHDVAIHMYDIAAMFLRANEVEELIRDVLAQVPDADLNAAKGRFKGPLTKIPLDSDDSKYLTQDDIDPLKNGEAEPRLVDSFGFADYLKCVADENIWQTYFAEKDGLKIDKELCIRTLNDARLGRNKVMHFDRGEAFKNLIPSFEASATWLRKISAR